AVEVELSGRRHNEGSSAIKAAFTNGYGTLAVLFLLNACGDGGTGPSREPAAITIESGNARTGTVGMATDVAPTVRVTDERGNGVAEVPVTFTAENGGWTVKGTVLTDAQGMASTTWYLGPEPGVNTLTARAAGRNVQLTAEAEPLVVGESYFGTNDYVQLITGDLPLILSAPHGGHLL